MLPLATVPASLLAVLGLVRQVFTAPTFATFTALVVGTLGATGRRTVTRMWSAAGLAGPVHWGRAHRFFSHARWDADVLGLALARVIVDWFIASGAEVTVAVDDSLFPRFGTKVFGAAWQHDGSARGRDGLGRGTCFVVAGLVVTVPFLARPVCLPVLFRLHIPKVSASKAEQARVLVDLLAAAFADRTIHVVGDAAYRGPAWRTLPDQLTFTTRLAATAVLYAPQPPATGRRGQPRWKGDRLGTPGQVAAGAIWRTTTVGIYGRLKTVDLVELDCLWWGSLHRRPVKVILMRTRDSRKAYDWALVTTDLAATAEQIVIRYAARWSIEQSIKDGKDLLGVGEVRNRTQRAVERTVPFGMCCLTLLVLWYTHAGSAPVDLAARRAVAPWYRHKRHVSLEDMIIAFRRARITDITAAGPAPGQFSGPALYAAAG
jgi:hypothetical protein